MDIKYFQEKYNSEIGNWHIVRHIGSGSFGKVFEINREEFGRVYKAALKIITIPQSEEQRKSIINSLDLTEENANTYFQEMVNDLAKEISVMAELQGNSNIVSYLDHQVIYYKDKAQWDILIRMELLTPFGEYCKSHDINEEIVAKLGKDICNALITCKQKNIIHRDIKPENIFVTKEGDFKLGDFGVARTIEKTTGASTKVGTYDYMSPEVYQGKNNYDFRTDIYSLGLVMYRLLNGNKLPFLPTDSQSIGYSEVQAARNKRFEGEKLPEPAFASSEMSKVILKACKYNVKDRYTSPEEMLLSLETITNGRNKGISINKIKEIIKRKAVRDEISGGCGDSISHKYIKTYIIVTLLILTMLGCIAVGIIQFKINSSSIADISNDDPNIELKKTNKVLNSYNDDSDEQEFSLTDNETRSLFDLYALATRYDIENIINHYALGNYSEKYEGIADYNGEIGDLIEAYKDIDLNGDGITDTITRNAYVDDYEINVSFHISITGGSDITTKTLTMDIGNYSVGGEVLEFHDINNDGIDEVLISQYSMSTAGYYVKDSYLYYVYENKWYSFCFNDEIDDVAGAELGDDGIAILVDYASKWYDLYDVFFYKMDNENIICAENSSLYTQKYWPEEYNESPSIASNLSDKEKEMLSNVLKEIYITGILPDGVDISEYIKGVEDGVRGICITLLDLGVEDDFGIEFSTWIYPDAHMSEDTGDITRLYDCSLNDGKVYSIADADIRYYLKNGYIISVYNNWSEYHISKYNKDKKAFEIVCETESLDNETAKKIIDENEILYNPPTFYLNKNIELYKKMNSSLRIIDNGNENLEQSDMVNVYY